MKIRHPLEFIPSQSRKGLFFTFLALTLILLFIFRILDQPLQTDAAPNGILSFELAGDPRTARAITDSWKQRSLLLSAVLGRPDPNIVNIPYVFAAFGLGLDYLFMPVYALTLSVGSLLAARRHEGLIKTLGALAGYVSFAALVFDAIENYSLLRVLLGEVQSVYPALAAFCAIVKFGLIAFSLFYILTAWLLPRK